MPDNSMGRLREIRDIQREAKGLNPERDKLIRDAAQDHSERAIARACGLSRARVGQIVRNA